MRAVLLDGLLRYASDHPEPVSGAADALIRVRLAGVCGTDLELTRGYKGGFAGVLGHEFVGEVVQCAETSWVGKRVCADINVACGSCDMCGRGIPSQCYHRTVVGIFGRDGVFADFAALPIRNLHAVPDNITDEQAVFVEPLAASFQILEQVQISPGERVVVLGDGRLGNLCAQVLAGTEADLLVIGKHPSKLALLQTRGIAISTLDDALPQDVDVVIEATASPAGLSTALRLLRPRGRLVLKSTVATPGTYDLSPIVVKELTVIGSRCGPFERAIAALQRGEVNVEPLIEERFPLTEGIQAFARAAQQGVLKVLIDPCA